MDTFLLILSAACLAWGLGLALTFRIIPAVAHAIEARHPIARTAALLARWTTSLRMTWSAR